MPYAVLYIHMTILYYQSVLKVKGYPFTSSPSPSGNHQSVFCTYESVSILFVHFCSLDFTFKWNHMVQYLSFSVWLISRTIIPSRFIHVVANGKIKQNTKTFFSSKTYLVIETGEGREKEGEKRWHERNINQLPPPIHVPTGS